MREKWQRIIERGALVRTMIAHDGDWLKEIEMRLFTSFEQAGVLRYGEMCMSFRPSDVPSQPKVWIKRRDDSNFGIFDQWGDHPCMYHLYQTDEPVVVVDADGSDRTSHWSAKPIKPFSIKALLIYLRALDEITRFYHQGTDEIEFDEGNKAGKEFLLAAYTRLNGIISTCLKTASNAGVNLYF